MKLFSLLLVALMIATTGFATPRNIQNSGSILERETPGSTPTQDDIWSVIEFPEGQEVNLELTPLATMPTAKGTARVLRGSNGTEINLDVSGVTGDVETYHVYAIDSLGNATTVGTLSVSNGSSNLRAQTALTKFMILVSPKDDVVSLNSETIVILRSTVPDGFKVVPRASSEPVSEPTATPTPQITTEAPNYETPLLGIGTLRRGISTQFRARLSEDIRGGRVNVSVMPKKNGQAQIKMSFNDLKSAPDGGHYVLWAMAPDNSYILVGKVNAGKQTKIDSNISLADFGLFITIEDSATPSTPRGKLVATIIK